MTVQDFTLYDALDRNARAFGERTALITETGTAVSFAELRTRVDRLAAGLAARGLEKGDRIAIVALNSAAFLELFFACARQGCIAYPLNWRLTPDEIERILERASARMLVVDEASRSQLPASAGNIEHHASFDGEERPLGDLYIDPPESFDRPAVGSNDIFTVIATAAVDVVPRGAMLSHGNLVAANLQEIAALTLRPDDCNLVALPLFHIAGLGHCLSHFHAGASNVVAPRFDAAEAVQQVDEHRVTHLSDFPPILAQILDAAEEAGSSLDSLRWVSGLDAPDTMQRLHDQTAAAFVTGFGQCETTGFVTLQNARERLGCAGKPCEACSVQLVDDYDRPVAVGEEGEIVVRGPLVFLGYDGQPDVTEYTFRNGWHHTGDVGRFDEEGNLFYVKRKAEKELIKPGGENVYPAEVESVVVELESVREVCVIGVPDAKWGEAIKAVVELAPGARAEAQDIIDHVASRIARFKKPHHVAFVESLPRDDAGEIDREAVRTEHG